MLLARAEFWSFVMNLAVVALGLLAAAAAGCALYFGSQVSALRDADLEKYKAGTAVEVADAASRGAEALKEAKRIEADSKLEIARLKRDVSKAEERGQLAELAAKEADLARIKLEALVAPRRLNDQQLHDLGRLPRHPGTSLTVRSYLGDVESAVLATQIWEALRASGITVKSEILRAVPDNVLRIGVQTIGERTPLVREIERILSSSGSLHVIPNAPPESNRFSLGGGGPATASTIFIGAKPMTR